MLSPICTIPTDILSRIFEQLVLILGDPDQLFRWARACLSHAFALRSVSAHFRNVALGTPELWKRVSIHLPNRKAIGNSSALLKHCMALAGSVNVSIIDTLDEQDARLAISILLTPYTMSKVRAFELVHSTEATSAWIKKLEGSSFPMLDELSMKYSPTPQNFDFGSLMTVTRLTLDAASIQDTIITPSSLRYLTTSDISLNALVSLLYQCPNLVEFSAVIYPSWENGIQFYEPLTLSHLKRLTFHGIDLTTTPPSLQNLQLPSAETLQLTHHEQNQFIGFILLCQNVSATLTTLKIRVVPNAKLERDEFYQLWKIPFPNLRELEFTSISGADSENAIRMLKMRADECSNTESRCLPSLTNLTLRSSSSLGPRCLLVLLDQSKIGDVSYFHFEFQCFSQGFHDWSPELRKELRSIVDGRQIEVTWNGNKILQLSRDVDGSGQKVIIG